ncbi:carbohydrate-binding module family 43 protein [Canariomyces notabilis]|uniref:1,3-beta-glucanosyltransferase n=1 Tax=Canariomyces notabilis TaxID=2074819 RepID=A0AAN6THY9_9PEZI|nr:carbohydrate-binding module family 43 protein [Canariomyces arenarius]
MRYSTSSLVSAALLMGQASAALPPIVMKGTKFFYENGTQFFMKGIAYQQEVAAGGASTGSTKYTDPLADAEICKRDVPLLQALGTNTIRTYAIDPTKNHDECMKLLDDAGIYVISDLSEPVLSINRDDPLWNTELYKRYTDVVDSLSKYSNVIGFFAGNEVTNNRTNTMASAYVKAAVRDTKAHIKNNVKRWMGVGYAANDDADIRTDMAHYFNCGDQESAIDYWGYNIYSWCGKSSMSESGYDKQVEFFSNYSVPVFFAEYGCNLPDGAEGRIWDETTALYSDEMTGVFSGGIVYMYFQEANDYGLVTVKNDEATTMKNYDALKTVMSSVAPSSTAMDSYQPTNSPAACPPISNTWKVKGNALPPTPDTSLCDCMFNSISCGPSSSLKETEFGDIFGFICGESPEACAGINRNTTTGVYGAYSMCSAKQQLGYVLDQYYKSQNSASGACDFDGKAEVKSSSVGNGCQEKLESASAANSVAATATGLDGAASTGGASNGTDENAAPSFTQGPLMRRLFAFGGLEVGLYMAVALFTGVTMLVL